MSRYYRRPAVSQDEINTAAAEIREQLSGHNFEVAPNAYGHRIACTVRGCGWSKTHDTVSNALAHAATH